MMKLIGCVVMFAMLIAIVVQLCELATDIFGILFKVFSDKKHKS